jgi:hypothetical protein
MHDLSQLRQRIGQLDPELDRVLRETEQLRRAHRRKLGARFVLSLFAALLLGAYGSRARTPQLTPNIIHAPFEVIDSSGRKIFQVTRDHSFYVFTEKEQPAIIAHASETDSSFKVQPTDGGPWVKLGLAGMKPFLKLSPGGESEIYQRIALTVDGTPELVLRNPSGIKVFDLLQGKAFPGGELGLFDGRGTLAVRAGSSEAGIGRVEAFPLGNPIGSSIVGRLR